MANPIPGTMIVDAPQADPWEEAFGAYRQALIDLNGDGIPDAVVGGADPIITTGEVPVNPNAYDPDGKPRVPASGGRDPYPQIFPSDRFSQSTNWIDDPGTGIKQAVGQASNMLMGLAGASPAAGVMGNAARGVGRFINAPEAVFPWARRAAEASLAPVHAAEARMAAEAAKASTGATNNLMKFAEGVQQWKTPPAALTYEPGSRVNALQGGMVLQRGAGGSRGAVAPSVDPASIARAEREATVGAQRQFRDAASASQDVSGTTARIAQTKGDTQVDDVAQRLLSVARERVAPNATPDQLASIPRGVYERLLANEGLGPYLQASGRTMDDVVASMQRQGYALSPFNGNNMMGRTPTGQLQKMTPDERALRDTIWSRTGVRSGRPGPAGSEF